MIEFGDYTYLYLKNLYFKSLRWFCRYPTYPYLYHLYQHFHSKTLIFDKKLNLLEK
nr:orotate phosphoribosyltransferase [Helicobacter pylori]